MPTTFITRFRIEAGNGSEALAILRHRPVTVLFTDIRTPGMTGIELGERAREMQPDLKVVLATGYAFPHEMLGITPVGTPVLSKPFSPHQAVQLVKEQLEAGT